MVNEYGVKLDSNGYAPSVINAFESDACFLCDRMGDLVRHEVFHGNNRQKSKALGCWVCLCPQCHMMLHSNQSEDWSLKRLGQRCAMNWYDWTIEDFRKRFGRNYLEE